MIVASLDLSTCTGVSIWDTRDQFPQHNFIINMPEVDKSHYDFGNHHARVAGIGYETVRIRKEFSPDVWIVEKAMFVANSRSDMGFILTHAIHGAVRSHLYTTQQLSASIASQTWRKYAYGTGFKQPLLPARDRLGNQKLDEHGKLMWKKKDWGDIAIERCELLKIPLPNIRKEQKQNAAEAALMAIQWRHARCDLADNVERFIALGGLGR